MINSCVKKMTNICIVYTHHKLGDLIWQLPYIKAISEHHKQKIDLIVRKKTQAKNILKDLDHINLIKYNDFRKGLFYWIDVAKLMMIYKYNKYTHVYVLDKVNKPAIAAKLCGVKNIIGPGIGNQKKWLTVKKYLTNDDWKLSYSEQSQKLLKLHNIKLNNQYPEIDSSETYGMCDQMSSSLELFLGDNQMKLFGVHTIIDGEQFTKHNDKTKKYTKYFSIHMLDKKPDEDLVSRLTKTFFQEETLNDVRVVGKNILQCNLKVTSTSEPDSSGCDKIEKLLSDRIK